MRVVCMSDFHGHLPKLIDIPECDLILLAGDYAPCSYIQQPQWFRKYLEPWIHHVSTIAPVVGVAGNHDGIFQHYPFEVPEMDWIYLQDSGTEVKGMKVYGSPWQKIYFNWAFNADEDFLEQRWSMIPDDTDIILLHGPPYWYGDLVSRDNIHVGSPSLTKRIVEIRPKLVVFGHIHEGHGEYKRGNIKLVNASLCDEQYKPTNSIIVVDI